MRNRFTYFIIALVILSSCRKDEIAIKPLDRGDVITASVVMGVDYKQQIFYSLSENAIVSSNLKTAWDLGFECGANGYHIKLNGAKAMTAFNTGQTNFASVTDTSGMKALEKVDSPTGNLDSTAFGNWQSTLPVYIVDRGFNELGTHQGFRKMQMLSVDQTHYIVKTANLNGSNEITATISKDETENYIHFSFNSNSVVAIDPGKENYDLLFSQYTHVYHDPYSIYLVTGVLINPNRMKIAEIFDKPFNEIAISDSITHPFKTHQNTMGYYWKTYSFSTSSYTVNSDMNYLIKDVKGFYYKLHFIDFYNSLGQKGCPKFEFKKL